MATPGASFAAALVVEEFPWVRLIPFAPVAMTCLFYLKPRRAHVF
jgi:hypothetical protein